MSPNVGADGAEGRWRLAAAGGMLIGMHTSGNRPRRGQRPRIGHYILVALPGVGGTTLLATGQSAGIGWGLLLVAAAVIVTASSDRSAGRGPR
jgi:hypothetical protein